MTFREIALRILSIVFTTLALSVVANAQGGPPLITNDPVTPGNGNWEINLGLIPELTNTTHNVRVPQIDLNYGIGKHIQLNYEVPFVWQSAKGAPNATG